MIHHSARDLKKQVVIINKLPLTQTGPPTCHRLSASDPTAFLKHKHFRKVIPDFGII